MPMPKRTGTSCSRSCRAYTQTQCLVTRAQRRNRNMLHCEYLFFLGDEIKGNRRSNNPVQSQGIYSVKTQGQKISKFQESVEKRGLLIIYTYVETKRKQVPGLGSWIDENGAGPERKNAWCGQTWQDLHQDGSSWVFLQQSLDERLPQSLYCTFLHATRIVAVGPRYVICNRK